MGTSWKEFIAEESKKDYYKNGLKPFVEQEYATCTVYPPHKNIFKALAVTPFDECKVVIIGQDPYINENQAMGLAFSVPDDTPLPPSLYNILREVRDEYGFTNLQSGNLTPWANQGVLLLNTVLTARAGASNSHAGHGWETFTDAVVRKIATESEHPVVFMLWGQPAQKKLTTALAGHKTDKHLYLTAPHPSPLSAYRGFFGCGHFKACNEFLEKTGQTPILW